ncbi:MAG: hydroxyphenylacetyl-CoA thioesterase PaaI [Mycobacteriales bacterium]
MGRKPTAAEDELARRCAEAMYAADRASQALGITLDEVGAGRARGRMTVRADMCNGHGLCHGGFVFSLADSAFAFACNGYNQATVAAGCDIVFVRPVAAGDVLMAEACERVRVGRNGVYDVTVRREDGEVVAEFRGRSRTVAGSVLGADSPPPSP